MEDFEKCLLLKEYSIDNLETLYNKLHKSVTELEKGKNLISSMHKHVCSYKRIPRNVVEKKAKAAYSFWNKCEPFSYS